MSNRPLYPISIVAELLGIHPETIRIWERHSLVKPGRRGGKRFYSDDDLKRLQFIQKLIGEGLNIPSINHYLMLYPCWELGRCPACMHESSECVNCAKVCWKSQEAHCEVSVSKDKCAGCEFHKKEGHMVASSKND